MAEEKPKDQAQKDERNRDDADPEWEDFKDFVKKMAQVPKEELNEKLAEREREKRERKRQAG